MLRGVSNTLSASIVALCAVCFCLQARLEASDPESPVTVPSVDSNRSVPTSVVPGSPASNNRNNSDSFEKVGEFRKKIAPDVDELLRGAFMACPALRGKISDKLRIEILRAIGTALDKGIEYRSSVAGKRSGGAGAASADVKRDASDSSKDAPPTPRKALLIASNKVLYARLDSFDEKSVKTLVEDLTSVFRQSRKPVGVILDLRTTDTGEVASAVSAASLFASYGKLPKVDGARRWRRMVHIPTVVLIGSGTRGPSEVFALLVTTFGKVATMGTNSSGHPFPKKEITLSNGDVLSVPRIPRGLEEIPRAPVTSAIECDEGKIISYKNLRGHIDAYKKDSCLKRAVDLVICLEAISSR